MVKRESDMVGKRGFRGDRVSRWRVKGEREEKGEGERENGAPQQLLRAF
jgi:hypothetical protein